MKLEDARCLALILRGHPLNFSFRIWHHLNFLEALSIFLCEPQTRTTLVSLIIEGALPSVAAGSHGARFWSLNRRVDRIASALRTAGHEVVW